MGGELGERPKQGLVTQTVSKIVMSFAKQVRAVRVLRCTVEGRLPWSENTPRHPHDVPVKNCTAAAVAIRKCPCRGWISQASFFVPVGAAGAAAALRATRGNPYPIPSCQS